MTTNINEIVRYVIAGIINTIIGYSIFIYLVYVLEINPFYSNITSYIIALFVAFILNKYFVFNVEDKQIKRFIMFIISFIIAYSINLVVLFLSLNIFNLNPAIAQIFAMIFYTFIFYLLNKFIVFKLLGGLNQ